MIHLYFYNDSEQENNIAYIGDVSFEYKSQNFGLWIIILLWRSLCSLSTLYYSFM